MCEIKQNLKNLEQRCKIFHQQQFIFIAALDRCRENAREKIKPVTSLSQVQYYLENHCTHTTDRRIMNQFMDLCRDLLDFTLSIEKVETDSRTAGGSLAVCKTLLSLQNDLTCIRARFPHDEVNHLSINESKNFYGGIVSIIPLVLDNLKLGIATLEKPKATPRLEKTNSNGTCPVPRKAAVPTPGGCHNNAAQTTVTIQDENSQPHGGTCGVRKRPTRPAWKPNGRYSKF
ncbi:sperm acrosome-associated protein 9 isoform X2 [Ambystoma mexicanum]|uniref:sperm acrosome-associated protein 9 isoform X2 n=1 Tax=Ambystoma mexicanum TaxID=8296 RepID=UPI0037E9B967